MMNTLGSSTCTLDSDFFIDTLNSKKSFRLSGKASYMKYLKHMAVVKYEKLLINHLSLGGDVRDATGNQLVGQQILAVWNHEGIRDMCVAQGITMDAMGELYSACIEHLMPNPCIKGGGGVIMLVPTLFLIEDWRLRELLAYLAEANRLHFDNTFQYFKAKMIVTSKQLKASHDSARGPVQFAITPNGGLLLSEADPVKSSGCASVVLLLLALAPLTFIVAFLI
jgi:hypothetical protein